MIETYQGDTKSITVILKSNGTQINLVSGDSITLTVKKSNSAVKYIEKIVTSFTNGQAIINLTTTDTNIEVGNYVYDIQYDKQNGERYTIISDLFVIKRNV